MRIVNAALLALICAAPSLGAQAASAAPTAGWRAEVLNSIGEQETKFVQLAEATPWAKFSYRPGPGVRSTCEVFLHIGGDGYMMAEPYGTKMPATIDMKTIEKCPESKEKVLAVLKGGFAFVRSALLATKDSDADAAVKIFGQNFTKRGLGLAIVEHGGEHLGQSIAYARTNGIVPPWSAKSGS